MDSNENNIEKRGLHQAGLKATLPRIKVLTLLEENADLHLSAEDIYQRLHDQKEEVSLATVYRVLTQFEAAGLVIRHNFEGGSAVYELDQGDHHDHLVCVQCGAVTEFLDPVIEKQQDAVAKKYAFKIVDHNHTIYGVCERCQKAL